MCATGRICARRMAFLPPRPAERRNLAAALGGTLVLLAALALAPGAAIADELELEVADINNNDPIEPVNRALFEVNQFADHNLMRPVAQAYRDLLPRPVQSHIHNFLSNLSEPAIGLNDVLQGNPGRFWTIGSSNDNRRRSRCQWSGG